MKISDRILFILGVITLCSALSSCHSDNGNGDENSEPITAKVTASDLSNQRVTAFAEDAQGFMWIGTFRGLNSFNSHKFHQYFCTDQPDDLPDNQINSLFCDSKQRLWVATIWGVATHNNQDKFTLYPVDDTREYCKQVFEGIDGRVFAISGGKFAVLNEEEKCFNVKNVAKTPKREYQYGFMDFGGRLWLCDITGTIDILNGESFAREDSVSVGAAPISFCRDTDQNLLYIGTPMGLKVVDISMRRTTPLPAKLQGNSNIGNGYVSVVHKHNGNLLIATVEGLYCYTVKTGELKLQGDNGFPFDVPDYVTALYTDSHNNLWIGSYYQGFTLVTSKERFNSNHFLVAKLLNKPVYSLAADKSDRLWISTLNGTLYVYDHKPETFSEIETATALSSKTKSKDITTVYADRNGDIWLASLITSNVSRCKYEGGRLLEQQNYRIEAPLSISQDDQGNMWIGTGNGKLHCIYADGKLVSVPVPFGNTFVPALQPLPGGKVWATAFNNLIYSVNAATKQVEEAGINREQWTNCLTRSVFIPTDLCHDSYGNIWIGTVGNGLLRYDSAAGTISHMKGLPCTDIAAIREDRQGNIWISSQYGMASYDYTSNSFKSYFKADGIGGNQFYDRSACILSDGTLVFGGTHGVTIFNPIDVKKPYEAPLKFDELTIHNQPVCAATQSDVIKESLCFSPQVTLDYTQNGFSVSFASLNYSGTEHDNYTYRLEGHDKYWIKSGQINEAYYANLSPGNYTFKVRVVLPNGTVADNEIALPIKVKPAPWRSWWAILFYVIVVAAVARVIYKARRDYTAEREQRRQAERDREQERRLNTINMSFFSNISHEFRTPLTMISGPVAQLQNSGSISGNERRLLDVVQRNVLRMLRLVNQMMDFNKLENDTLRLQVEHVDALIYLRHTVETFAVNAEEKGITLKTSGMEDDFVTWIDTDKLEKIMNNLLSNAMKVTPPGSGQIEVEFDVVEADEAKALAAAANQQLPYALPCMKFVVSDNGPGLPPTELNRIFDRYYQLHDQGTHVATRGTGIGLYYSRALAKLHHGCLFAENRNLSQQRSGARFTLLIPVGEDAYSDTERVTATTHFATTTTIVAEKPMPAEEQNDDDKATLLIVDDDSDVVSYLKTLLSPHYNVIPSYNADTAFELALENHPDLILSDVIMPVTDGYDLCRRIKNDLNISHIPVILVTAKATVENQVEGLNTGADAYVTKPFDPKYLLALIKSQLLNRQKARNILCEATEISGIEADVLSGPDKAFMDELYKLMENELSNPELDITLISGELHVSRTKLFYKIKGLTCSTPAVFFKTYKLNRAAELIAEGTHTMSEIAFMTGFSTQAHFSTSFKKQFGVTPSAYKPTNGPAPPNPI